MAEDRSAVVWTRLGGEPRPMGRFTVTDRECRFTYAPGYADTGLPGLGVLYPPWLAAGHTLAWRRSAWFNLFPQLQAHIPPESEGGFQRRLILRYLERQGIHPAPGFDADWAILMVAGHGGIGHLDIFPDDTTAEAWYRTEPPSGLFPIGERIGFSLKEFLTWLDADAAAIIETLGPTPSVGGAIPKLLLTIPDTGWDGRVGLPSRGPTPGRIDVVVKFEKESYRGIAELEALTLELHARAGLRVPRYWLGEAGGVPVIAIERYDRDQEQTPLFTESLYAVMASGDRTVTNHYSSSYDAIGRAIDVSPIPLVSEPREAKAHLLKRLLLAFATGNGDLHLENLSLWREGEWTGFSPVYDPTPMRAWRRHDLLAAMPFDGYGDLDEAGRSIGFEEALRRFALDLGFRRPHLRTIVEEVLQVTIDYPDEVRSLRSLPEENRRHLAAIACEMRERLERVAE